MGQQQLLLIVLGVIIVGIAVLLGIILFRQGAIDNKRDLLINEGLTVANNAREYYFRPSSLGGGQYSFSGWQIPTQLSSTANGSYTASVTANQVEITGTGNELISGSDYIEVKFIITRDGIATEIIN